LALRFAPGRVSAKRGARIGSVRPLAANGAARCPPKPAVTGTLPARPHDISRVAPKGPPAGRSPPQIASTLPGRICERRYRPSWLQLSGGCCTGVHSSNPGELCAANSGESRSASRPWAASSPLLQAFNKAVISADDPSMGSAFFLQSKKYTRPWRNLLKASACTSGRRTKLPE
jgi:hypothetical protein